MCHLQERVHQMTNCGTDADRPQWWGVAPSAFGNGRPILCECERRPGICCHGESGGYGPAASPDFLEPCSYSAAATLAACTKRQPLRATVNDELLAAPPSDGVVARCPHIVPSGSCMQ